MFCSSWPPYITKLQFFKVSTSARLTNNLTAVVPGRSHPLPDPPSPRFYTMNIPREMGRRARKDVNACKSSETSGYATFHTRTAMTGGVVSHGTRVFEQENDLMA
ncbi:hypothetical protein BgiMline_001132 [Biomphalaria glabrata]|nr:hypothetical protein BgiMline_001047 [Biomphalaria glabrata]